jgi:hypothetical protein
LIREDISTDWDTWVTTGWIELSVTTEGGLWHFTVEFDAGEVSAMRFAPPAGTPLTASLLRTVNPGLIERRARQFIAALNERLVSSFASSGIRLLEAARRIASTPGLHADREGYLQALAALSALYVKRSAESPHAARELAADIGIPKDKLLERLRAAERNGVFTRTTVSRGRAGGEITQKTRDILGTMEVEL